KVLQDPRKLGLEVPEDRWVRGPLATMIRDTVESRRFRERGIWRPKQVNSLVQAHIRAKSNHGNLIWRIICIELWFRMFIDSVTQVSVARERVGPRAL